ncbi:MULTISPECIES: hypothetical protein [Halorussus]|uniref:hypothetical protein n=1 Tax=Halorussus TaxID=1070314 RepID=UPI0020A016D3|nr:hypothetical protein [Halorussus vallis]USZ77373.1 hypothetical protein NGM07_08580 [Halorussus vallis]
MRTATARSTDRRDADADTLREAIVETAQFAYAHGLSLLAVSLAWTVMALPVVTVGPATLAAYAAVGSLRARGSVDWRRVAATVRKTGGHALLLGWVLLALAGISGLYAAEFLRTGDLLAGVLTVISVYGTLYTGLVLSAAFVALSDGADVRTAVGAGTSWVRAHPTLAVSAALVTAALFVVSLALTVAVVLVFPAVAFSLHHHLLARAPEDDEGSAVESRAVAG